MGLFTSNKKLCPICSSPTSRLFAVSVEGMPLCKECGRKADLPDGMLDGMTLAEFRQYMDFYNENKELQETFKESIRLVSGYAAENLLIDKAKGLFRLKDEEKALVFEASNLVSFRILEDDELLFESAGNALKCYKSHIPERVKSMSAEISQIVIQRQMYEQMERMERERQRERERNGETDIQPSYYSSHDVKLPVPLNYFYVELNLNHPYWGGFCGKLQGPRFGEYHPSVDEYLNDYKKSVDHLHKIALVLMQMISPGAGEIKDGASATSSESAPAADHVSEIKKYKELLDAGVITEEEFTAKKRQLLGI